MSTHLHAAISRGDTVFVFEVGMLWRVLSFWWGHRYVYLVARDLWPQCRRNRIGGTRFCLRAEVTWLHSWTSRDGFPVCWNCRLFFLEMKLFEGPKRNWQQCCWNILWAHCLRRRKDCSKLYHPIMWMPAMDCSWLPEGRQAHEQGRQRKIWFCSWVSNPFCHCPTFHCPHPVRAHFSPPFLTHTEYPCF